MMVVSETKKRLLIIDDEQHLLVTLGDSLIYEGYDVVKARDGNEALMELEQVRPDLIILDVRMPGMNGVSFLEAITDPEGKPRYPVLILTAVSTMEEFFGTVAVDGFLAKPCDGPKLLAKVEEILARRDLTSKRRSGTARRVLVAGLGAEQDLQRAFSEAGYEIGIVKDGAALLERAAVEHPDAIVLRESMPGMSGSTIAAIIAAMPSTRATPIVLCESAQAGERPKKPSAVARSLQSEEPAVLVATVKELLEA